MNEGTDEAIIKAAMEKRGWYTEDERNHKLWRKDIVIDGMPAFQWLSDIGGMSQPKALDEEVLVGTYDINGEEIEEVRDYDSMMEFFERNPTDALTLAEVKEAWGVDVKNIIIVQNGPEELQWGNALTHERIIVDEEDAPGMERVADQMEAHGFDVEFIREAIENSNSLRP